MPSNNPSPTSPIDVCDAVGAYGNTPTRGCATPIDMCKKNVEVHSIHPYKIIRFNTHCAMHGNQR